MRDGLFHVIEDLQIVLRRKGVYRQCKVYHRDGRLYAAWHASGFVALMTSGTSHPDVSWEGWPEHPLVYKDAFYLRYAAVSLTLVETEAV
jgi:hypothetical protein